MRRRRSQRKLKARIKRKIDAAKQAKASKPAAPDFRGPVVQGPVGQRFVYIDIGTYAGQTDTPWSRRLKIPLIGVTWDVIDRASATQMVLETRVPGTARDGGPTCATVKPFGGWKLVL